MFTSTGSSNLEVLRERSQYDLLAIIFCSWEEMHFLQYWGIYQKEIDTPCQVYLCTLLKENCQPCCWIIWSHIKSKVVLCWLSIEHTIGNKCRLFSVSDVLSGCMLEKVHTQGTHKYFMCDNKQDHFGQIFLASQKSVCWFWRGQKLSIFTW